MKRKCIIIKSSEVFARHVCIDVENEQDISDIIFRNEKYKDKFLYLVGRILEQPNMYFDDYKRVVINSNVKISEMRFFPNGDNSRIYCREVSMNGNMFCVVMAKGLSKKKSQKMNKAVMQLINTIKEYEYEIG